MSEAVEVIVGTSRVRLNLCRDGAWRWHYYSGGKRRSASCRDLEKAKSKARQQLQSIVTARGNFRSLSEADASLFIRWSDSIKAAPAFPDAAEQYLSTRRTAGLSSSHLRTLSQDVENLAAHFPQQIPLITTDMLAGYLDRMKCGPRRKNNLRQVMISVWGWFRARGMIPDTKTAADLLLKAREVRKPVTVFTPSEIRAILAGCGPEWRPAIAIQAFAGIRTEEVARLHWRAVRLDKGYIEVTAESAKTGRRRLVPIHQNLASFLHPPADENPPPPVKAPTIEELIADLNYLISEGFAEAVIDEDGEILVRIRTDEEIREEIEFLKEI